MRNRSERSFVASALALSLAVLTLLIPAQAAHAADTAGLTIQKTVSTPNVMPGETFNWVVQVGCSVLEEECINAQLVDVIPSEFIVGAAATVGMVPALDSAGHASVSVSGQTVTVDFSVPLASPPGQNGLDNQIVTITIPVTVRSNLPHTPLPVTVTNTAVITADNATQQTATADVSLTVPLNVATTANKSFAPGTVLGVPGSQTTVTFGGTNTSNSPVTEFSIQDPQTPAALAGIFAETLRVTSLGTVTWPAGAVNATVSVWDAVTETWLAGVTANVGDTLALPPAVPLDDIRGVRVTFTSPTPLMLTGQTAALDLVTSVRSAGSGSRSNTSTSTVSVEGVSSTAVAVASLNLEAATSSILAEKTISPDRLASKEYESQDLTSATVTLGARNTGTVPLATMSILEPVNPADQTSANPLHPNHTGGGLVFAGLGTVVWPVGATAGAITYYYSDGSNSGVLAAPAVGAAFAAPDAAKRVTGFAVQFSGAAMQQGAFATVPYTIDTNSAQTETRVDYLNTIEANGRDVFNQPVDDDASDTVTVFGDRIEVETSKVITTTNMLAVPGQQTTATLSTHMRPYPESTRNATQIIQYDPPLGTSPTPEWYEYFTPTQLILTNVPVNTTLTVQYLNSVGDWTNVTGLVARTGGPINQAISAPEAIHGLRLVWDTTAGFVPDQTLTANLAYQLRSTLLSGGALPNADHPGIPNCSSALATSGAGNAEALSACPEVELNEVPDGTGPGEGEGGTFVWKEFRQLNSNTITAAHQELINTRSSARTGVRLSWSTGGRTDVATATVTDSAMTGGSPDAPDFTKGMYDAFNLYRINPLTSATDPLLQYDRVAVQIYRTSANAGAGGWVNLSGTCTLASPCTSFAGVTLSAAQQGDTIGVRFIFTERSGRTSTTYPPGSGVAGALGTNRNIDLIFEIRDTLRSDPTVPVVNGPEYNTARTGVPATQSTVRNDVNLTAQLNDSSLLRANHLDTIRLQDAEIALNVTKSWSGSPVPLVGPAVTPRPTTRATVSTINQTSGTTVSQLVIHEPDLPLGDSPFDVFDLTRFFSFTHPTGATSIKVDVYDSTNALILTTNQVANAAGATAAQGWTALQLQNATSFTVHWFGRMSTGASGTGRVQVDLTLRPLTRSTSTAPVAGTVHNDARGTVGDLRFDERCDPESPSYDAGLGCSPAAPLFVLETLDDTATANVALVSASIAITAAKSFDPASQAEGTNTPISMRLVGTPSGSERVHSVTLTDDRSTFWNSFDFVAKGTITLPTFSPAGSPAQLQVEVCTGGTFTASAIATTPDGTCASRGGSWVGAGTWLSQAQLTAGQFLPAGVTPADVQGLRITVKRADDSQWENASTLAITLNLSVQRRSDMRSGGAVPSTYSGFTAAPGETVLGRTTNTVRADVLGVWGSTATASASANYSFTRQTTSVQVSKLPVGVRSPGTLIPFTLTMLNTGQRPIVNPVITDTMPVDGTGAMLIFNPDAATNYTLAVSGGSVPVGSSPIPAGIYTGSVAGVVTITPTVDAIGPTSIEFRFPAGTVIGVGQTVTVTIPLMFRPGLANNVPVQNGFEVRGDRALDACTAPSGSVAPATLTSAGFGCSTTATVTLAQAPALRAFIAVKALETPGIDFPGWDDPNSQFTGGTIAACRAAQITDGFSRPPCAPTTIPGQDSTWRLVVQNTGTTPVSRLVVATRLPNVGDQTIVNDLVRSSRWQAQFNGLIEAQFGPGTTVQTFYTTRTQPCEGVLQTPTNTAACGSDPATGWAPLPVGGLADPTVVTGLQFVVDFPVGDRFTPGEYAVVDIGTTTAATLGVFEGTVGSNPLAINSLSVSGISPTAATPRISALDYSRALLGLATGSVTLTKEVTGPAAGFLPGFGTNPGTTTFTGELTCDLLGEIFTHDFTFTLTGGVISPSSLQFDLLPGGADCTVSEDAASGQTDYDANTVTVNPLADPANLPNIELVNDYQLTELEIRKVVTAPIGTIIPTDFAFTVTCSFLGLPITLDPSDASFVLDDGEVKVITGLPVNADCSVQETDNQGAGATVVDGATVAPGSVVENQATSTVTINGIQPQPAATPSVNWAEFDNRYDVNGEVRVEKLFAGAAAAQFGSDPALGKSFTIAVVCEFEGTTQFDGDIVLNAANGWSQPIPAPLLPGTECELTEPDLEGADAVVFSPADPGPPADPATGVVTVPTGPASVTVSATNWYLTGAIEVTKAWVGDAGAIAKFGTDPALQYEFFLECTRDGLTVTLPGGSTRTVDSTAPTATFTGIASGADCVLLETESNGAYSWRVVDEFGDEVVDGEFSVTVDASALVDDQQQPPLSVENEFLFANVSVAKRVDLYRPGGGQVGPFEVLLSCTLDGRVIDPAEAATQLIQDGGTVTWTELAAGADCVITETNTGGALATDFRITDTTGALTARTDGTVATLAPLRPLADADNHSEFINSFALPVTGGPDSSWLIMPGVLLLLGGGAMLGGVAVRRRRDGEFV